MPGRPLPRDHGLELRWIFDIPADFGLPAAEVTASAALDHDVPGLVGFGIGGSERGFPRSMFAAQFDRTRAAGLHSVIHAGETTGPETIWDAVTNLGAERIEHGITRGPRSAAARRTSPSTGSPWTSARPPTSPSRWFADLDQHPIRELVAAGVPVTINTDDPPMFGTDLNTEYAIAARLLDLDQRGLADLALAAVRRLVRRTADPRPG